MAKTINCVLFSLPRLIIAFAYMHPNTRACMPRVSEVPVANARGVGRRKTPFGGGMVREGFQEEVDKALEIKMRLVFSLV